MGIKKNCLDKYTKCGSILDVRGLSSKLCHKVSESNFRNSIVNFEGDAHYQMCDSRSRARVPQPPLPLSILEHSSIRCLARPFLQMFDRNSHDKASFSRPDRAGASRRALFPSRPSLLGFLISALVQITKCRVLWVKNVIGGDTNTSTAALYIENVPT